MNGNGWASDCDFKNETVQPQAEQVTEMNNLIIKLDFVRL